MLSCISSNSSRRFDQDQIHPMVPLWNFTENVSILKRTQAGCVEILDKSILEQEIHSTELHAAS